MSYQKCPVCEGRQTVPAGFYEDASAATATTRETCRTCEGKGALLVVSISGPPLTLMKFGPGVWPTALPGFDKSEPWTGDEVPFPYQTTCRITA